MEEKIRKIVILFIEITGMSLFYALLNSVGIYKYIVVVLLGIFVIVLNFSKFNDIWKDGYLFFPVVFYCGMGLCLSVFGGNLTEWTFRTFGFWILPPVIAMFICMIYSMDRKRMIDMQFYGCILAYLPGACGSIVEKGTAESTFAFVFGLFVLYYAYSRKWLSFFVSVILLYYANKRIAMLAMVICLFLLFFMRIVKYSLKWIKTFWGMLMVVSVFYVYSIHSGVFENICNRLGIDTSHRLDVYPKIAQQIPQRYYWGKGLGAANEMLMEILEPWPWLQFWFENPHNDLLKIYIELGAIGLIIFLMIYLAVFIIAEKKITERALSQLFIIFVYFVLLMTTDNISIYILFLVPMHSICFAIAGEKKEKEHEDYAK